MNTLYKLAFEFKKTKLWKKLWDSQLFAVALSDGEMGYCSVMGQLGEHIALGLYPGEAGLRSYCLLSEEAENERHAMEYMLSQDSIMCSFENKDMLRDSEIAEVRAYCAENGLTLRGARAWPQLERCRPFHLPWTLREEEDKRRLAEALEAAVEVARRLKSSSALELGLIEGPPFEREIPLLIKTEEGYDWKSTVLPPYQSPVYPEAGQLYDLPLKRASSIKKRAGTWACDVFLLPVPASEEAEEGPVEEPYNAPHFPWVQMVFDEGKGLPLDVILCGEGEDYTEMFPNRFLELVSQHGRPRKLLVETERAAALYEGLSDRLGIRLEVTDECEGMDEALDEMLSEISRQDFEEGMVENFAALLGDVDDLSNVPDEVLFFMKELMESMGEELPRAQRQLLDKEVRKRTQ